MKKREKRLSKWLMSLIHLFFFPTANIADLHYHLGNYQKSLDIYEYFMPDTITRKYSFTDKPPIQYLLTEDSENHFKPLLFYNLPSIRSFLDGKIRTLRALVKTSDDLTEKKSYLYQIVAICNQLLLYLDIIKQGINLDSEKLDYSVITHNFTEVAIQSAFDLYQLTKNPIYHEQAFFFAEASRTSVLSESISESNAKTFSGIPKAVLDRESTLKSEITETRTALKLAAAVTDDQPAQVTLQKKLLSLQNQYEDFTESLESEYPRYYQLKYAPQYATPATIQQQLGSEEVLIEYTRLNDRLCIFLFTDSIFTVKNGLSGCRF